MSKQMHFTDWVVVAFILFLWSITSFWLWWPYDPITMHSIEILNPRKTVEQGGVLAYHVKYTKHTHLVGRVNRYFVNGKKHRLEADEDANGTLAASPKGKGEADIFLLIRKDTPVSKGKMQWTVTYRVNPLRDVTVGIDPPIYSDEFTVTERPEKRGPKGATGKDGKNFWGK